MSNYVEPVVNKYKRPAGIDATTKSNVFDLLSSQIKTWAYRNSFYLTDIKLSGSRAKGTAISLSSDMDMFISLSSTNTASLGSVFNSLYSYFNDLYTCRKQNVSIRVTYSNTKVDLVPGKRQDRYSNDHGLYKSKQDSWTKTNIDKHISMVKGSNLIIEIAAAKIWRERHGLDFPSIFLELATLEALKNRGTTDHDANFLTLLEYFRDNIQTVRIVDPANTNNVISSDLSATAKQTISSQARKSRNEQYRKDILW
ncbi:MAG: hypothetical protein LBK57_10310 [Clostridiales Family XIII bacterium]|nr:hypothetical protein [Clostridiales Family XIII bacterium]